MSDRDDSPLDLAARVCRLLSAGPCPLGIDGRQLAGVPDRRITVIELVRLFPRLREADADHVWRLAAAEAQAGHPGWRVVSAALVAGELRRLAHGIAAWGCLAAGSEAEAVVLATFVAAAERADLNAPAGHRVLRGVLAQTRERVQPLPIGPGRIRTDGAR